MKKPAVQVLRSESLFKGRVMEIMRDQIIEPGGVEAKREWIRHPGSVVVLPVFPDGRILLVSQYRYAASQQMWELVAGHKEPSEEFETGAHRELEEEAGYTAKTMTKLLDFYPSPGFLSEIMVVYVARGLSKVRARPEADERIASKIVPLAEVEDWIKRGKIRDAKTIASVLYYAKFARGKAERRR